MDMTFLLTIDDSLSLHDKIASGGLWTRACRGSATGPQESELLDEPAKFAKDEDPVIDERDSDKAGA